MSKLVTLLAAIGALAGLANAVRAQDALPTRPPTVDGDAADASELSFLVIGDWGFRGTDMQRRVAERLGVVAEEMGSSFVVTTGDNFYYDGVTSVDDAHWRESFEEVYTAKSLQTPWYVTLGNHDYNGSVDAQIEYGARSERWRLPARYHTAVHAIDDTTSVRLLFLDTELLDSATAALAGVDPRRQLAWLDSVLHVSTAQWHVAVGHRPIYTASRAGPSVLLIRELRPILEEHGVQAYFAGHDHDLQHLRPPGRIDYFISGAAGSPREAGSNEHSLFSSGDAPGFAAVSVTPRTMRVRFIDENGRELYATTFERNDLVSSPHVAGRFPASARPDRVVASWQADPATSLSVTWRTAAGQRNAVAQIARATASPDFVSSARTEAARSETFESADRPVAFHSVTFSDLEPETLYAYRVGTGEVWSEWHQFRTASEEPKPFSFIYLGDAQNNILSLWSRAIRGAYAEAPKARFIIHAGDLVNRANLDSEWGEWFEAGAWIQASVPSIAVPGNHEYQRGEDDVRRLSRYWRPQFALPTHGPPGLEETVYYLDYQGARIIALNSNERLEEQAEWLEKVLASNPNAWTVVTFHHPVFSVARGRDNPELRRLWKPLFDRYGVDLVLQGHDHAYGRGRNVEEGLTMHDDGTGTVYAVSVSGPKMYTVAEGTEWMNRRAQNTQLYQVIHVAGDTLRYEARTVTGELYDAFDLVQHPGSANELIERGPASPERLAPTEK